MGNPTVTPLVEDLHDGGFIVSVANGHRSFDQITLTGAAKVKAGTLLGMVTAAATAAAVALGTNTGNGAMGAITLVSTPTQIGDYLLSYTDATHFTVTAPDGQSAAGINGTPFAALGIGLTMTTGGTAMVAGDGFKVTTTAKVGNPGISAAANAGNVGNSTAGSLTVNGYAPQAGDYRLVVVEPAANAGNFIVEDPAGHVIGTGAVATAFKGGGLSFTLADGATDFASGDGFVITVAANTSGAFKAWDPANVDGSQVVAGILYATRDATAGDKPATAVTRAAEVNQSELIFPTGANTAVIAAGVAGLKAVGIVAR
jgi:hypothetical protein